MRVVLPCGCCERPEAPPVTNRAGLSAIEYRIGTYATFREAMLSEIAGRPALAGLTTRRSDDYAITFVELWSAVADVLTFYQERYANEAFLRTSTQRSSVRRLARLIGYSLRPGIAAVARLAFTVDAGKSVRIPAGLAVQSVPGQDELPQTFETLEAFRADARLNRLRVYPPPTGVTPLAAGAVEAVLAPGPAGLAAAAELAPGDRLLRFALGQAVEELTVRELRTEEDRVVLAWEPAVRGTLGAGAALAEAGRSFRLFGHNAPEKSMTPVAATNVPGGIRWSLANTSYTYPSGGGFTDRLFLDARYDGIGTGTQLLIVEGGSARALVTVTAVGTAEASLAGSSDSVTRVTVAPSIAPVDRRRVTVHELVGPAVPFWGYAYPDRLDATEVYLPGRRLSQDRIEVGRTVVRNEYEGGVRISVDEIERGRSVLIGDAETAAVPAMVRDVSIVGADVVFGPTESDAVSFQDLGFGAGSVAVTGLVSAALPSALALTHAAPALEVRIGSLGPRLVRLATQPTDVEDAARALRRGLRRAGREPAFRRARVLSVAGRLLVVPGGEGGEVEFGPTALDSTTVKELGLDPDATTVAPGVLSGPLSDPPTFTRATPQVAVTIGTVGPRILSLGSPPSLGRLAAILPYLLFQLDESPAFRRAHVELVGNRLLVLAGPFGEEVQEYLRLDVELEGTQTLDLDSRSAFLLGNVARVSHGETVSDEAVGNGDAAQPFQRFALKRRPLTYVPSPKAGGAESSLRVLVNNVRWHEAQALYGQSPTAQVYAVRTDDDGTTTIQFGDGETGAKPPSGTANVRATYRAGAGLSGRVGAGTLTSALDRPPGLKEVTNPRAATGGADPETLERARENAPQTVRTFGRAVSLRDFEDLVRASGEVAKADATWVWDGLERAVHVTVAGQDGGLFEPEDLARLGAGLDAARDPNHRLRLANYARLPVVLRATLIVHDDHVQDDVVAAARASALAALDFDALELGEPLHLSDVYRILQDAPGVVAVDVDELQPKRPADRNRPNVDRLPDGTPAPLQPHVRVFPARPDPARPGAVLPAELARLEDPSRDLTIDGTGGMGA